MVAVFAHALTYVRRPGALKFTYEGDRIRGEDTPLDVGGDDSGVSGKSDAITVQDGRRGPNRRELGTGLLCKPLDTRVQMLTCLQVGGC